MIPAELHQLFRVLCDSAQRVVLTTHINPDGDAIGSELSLARFLETRGAKVRILNQDPVPELLQFVLDSKPPPELYQRGEGDAALAQADLVILVDNSAPDRLGRMEAPMAGVADRVLCIDHHPTRDAPWAHNIVDVEAAATTAMIYELTRAWGWTPDAIAANAIYTGLATDTGFFRFNSTNARSHEIAAELLELGVAPARVYRAVYERNSVAYTRLLGHSLAGLRLDAGGAVASVRITRQLTDTLQAGDVDTSEITTALLAIDRVMVAVLFRELSDGRIKVSLRSKGDLDVHRMATEFGGGGHRNASGIVIEGRLNQVVQTVTERAASLLAASSPDPSV